MGYGGGAATAAVGGFDVRAPLMSLICGWTKVKGEEEGWRERVSFAGQMWRGEERTVAVAGGGMRLELEVNTCAEARWAGIERETWGMQCTTKVNDTKGSIWSPSNPF